MKPNRELRYLEEQNLVRAWGDGLWTVLKVSGGYGTVFIIFLTAEGRVVHREFYSSARVEVVC